MWPGHESDHLYTYIYSDEFRICGDVPPIPHTHLWPDVQLSIGATSTKISLAGICINRSCEYHGLNV
jgi:hypothetical protein